MEKVDEVMIKIADLTTSIFDLKPEELKELAQRCETACQFNKIGYSRKIYSHLGDYAWLEYMVRILS